MSTHRRKLTDIFARLGEELASFGDTPETKAVIAQAVAGNSWFTHGDILRSVGAIRSQMLDSAKLGAWLGEYPALPAAAPRNVGVIMAGNIPLVGFFDMLCVLLGGHACYYKPSSKDKALMEHVVSLLRRVWPDVPAYIYIGQPLGAVIATGGDNAVRQFRSIYGSLPAILRGNRASAAILTGDETREELDGLATDIFSYSGLGCRNVSHLLLPEGYDPDKLAAALGRHPLPSNKYLDNFRQRSAVLRMQGAEFTDGGFFMLRPDSNFPASVSEITYQFYAHPEEARAWIGAHDGEIQCVVGRDVGHPRAAGFGQSQAPALADYPDGVDVMAFLSGI